MKKVLAMLLALVLVFSLFACSSNTPTPSESPAPSQTVEPSAEPSKEPEDERLVKDRDAAMEDIIGNWEFIAQKTNGEWTELTDQIFIFEENHLSYSIYPSDIAFNGNVINVPGWACTMTAYFNTAGQLVLEDSRGPIYLCDNRTEVYKAAPVQECTPATGEQLVGEWKLYAWDYLTGGMYTGVSGSDVDDRITMTLDSFVNTKDGEVSSDCTLEDMGDGKIRLTDKASGAVVEWTFNIQADDSLKIDAPEYGMTFYYRKMMAGTPATLEDIQGEWKQVATEVAGSYNVTLNENLVIVTADDWKNIKDGVIASDCLIEDCGEGKIRLVARANMTQVEWMFYILENGDMMINAAEYDTIYYYTKTETGSSTGEEATFTVEDLVGTWSLYAWDLTIGGMYTEEADDFFVFTENTVTYIDNNAESGVWNFEFTDDNSMNLTGGTNTSWDLSYGEGGELVITDPAAYIVYYCTKQG